MSEYDAFLQEQVRQLYDRAHKQGRWAAVWQTLRRGSNELHNLAAIIATQTLRSQRAAGVHAVPLNAIRGSEGRCADFDAAFHPRQQHTRSRWEGIAEAMLREVTLPPVELIQLGDTYFVRDGHHRISVSRALGQIDIDAIVTVWTVDGPEPSAAPATARRPWLPAVFAGRRGDRMARQAVAAGR